MVDVYVDIQHFREPLQQAYAGQHHIVDETEPRRTVAVRMVPAAIPVNGDVARVIRQLLSSDERATRDQGREGIRGYADGRRCLKREY